MKRQNASRKTSKTGAQKKRKLKLRRETVRVLSSSQLSEVAGGADLEGDNDISLRIACWSNNCPGQDYTDGCFTV